MTLRKRAGESNFPLYLSVRGQELDCKYAWFLIFHIEFCPILFGGCVFIDFVVFISDLRQENHQIKSRGQFYSRYH